MISTATGGLCHLDAAECYFATFVLVGLSEKSASKLQSFKNLGPNTYNVTAATTHVYTPTRTQNDVTQNTLADVILSVPLFE